MSYSYFRSITSDHTQVGGSDSSDFTVLIKGRYAWMASVSNCGRVQNLDTITVSTRSFTVPADLVFSSNSAGTSLLTWEIEHYDEATGDVSIWVKLPTVSHTVDTVFYVVYGDISVTTFQGGVLGAAWDSNALAVYHLPDITELFTYDSTSNANDGTGVSIEPSVGQIDGGAYLDGTSSYVDVGVNVSSLQPTSAVTVSCWVTPTYGPQASGAGLVVQDYANPRVSPYCSYKVGCDGTYAGQIATSGSGAVGIGSMISVANGVTAFVVLTYDGSTLSIYVDGVLAASTSASGSLIYDPSGSFRIGANSVATEIPTAIVDEVHVSAVARSADWILAEYNNQVNPNGMKYVSL